MDPMFIVWLLGGFILIRFIVRFFSATPVSPAATVSQGETRNPRPKPASNPVNSHQRITGIGVGLTPKTPLRKRESVRRQTAQINSARGEHYTATGAALGAGATLGAVAALTDANDPFLNHEDTWMNDDLFSSAVDDLSMQSDFDTGTTAHGLDDNAIPLINPASGLPMVGGMGGVDAAGNLWGHDQMSDTLSDNMSGSGFSDLNGSGFDSHSAFDTSTGFDDTDPFNSGVGIDDSFSTFSAWDD